MLIAHFQHFKMFLSYSLLLYLSFLILATTFSQKLLSRISFRGFKQFDFLTRDFQIIYFNQNNFPN